MRLDGSGSACCSAFVEDVKEDYAEMREEFMAGLEDRRYLTIADARSKGLKVSWVRSKS